MHTVNCILWFLFSIFINETCIAVNIIAFIFICDYGCEEHSESENPKVTVTLVNENNEKKIISVEDKWLMDNNLDEGDEWPENLLNKLRR